MNCKNCGKELQASVEFCDNCETPVEVQAVEPDSQPTSVPKKSKSIKIALITAIVIIVLFGVFMILEATGVTEVTGWFNGSTEKTLSPEETAVAEYVESIRAEIEAGSNDNLSTVIDARGTSVVYGYHYKVDVPSETVNEITAILDSEDIVELYKALLSNLQTEEPAITSIIIEYYGNDGSLLYSNEY